MPAEPMVDSKERRTEQPASRAVSELSVSGMTCSNCARHVTEAIQAVPGVRSATVSLESQQAQVRWSTEAQPNVPAVIQAIQAEGYGAQALSAGARGHADAGARVWELNLWIGVVCTLPLMAGEWGFGLGMAPWFQWCSFALAGIVQTVAGAPFYRGAWNQLRVGNSNMDTLVALGSTIAFVYSVWALFGGLAGHLFFMESASIITLISVGHWLESRVTARASLALRALLNLAPPTARRQDAAGAELDVPVADLQLGDMVALRPGDRVPTDGDVAEGNSAMDESMLTGESAPVDKTAGSRLYAGTVNLNGRLLMLVTATGEETALARIVSAVQRAQTSRADIQRLGDRVSSVFVPVVVAVAALAGLWWGLAPDSAKRVHDCLAPFLWPAHMPLAALAAAVGTSAAVLIVACPCAMGLATPAAIMAASNAGAQRGILIRDGVALEKAGRITAVVFDKTGTLTAGKPTLAKTWQSPAASTGPSLPLAASLSKHSTHPISGAISSADPGGLEIRDWQEIPGAGVQGKCRLADGRWQSACLGSLKWLREQQVDLAAGDAFIAEWSAQGATLVGLAVENTVWGLFAVKDEVKPGAAGVIRQLRRQKFETYLVTGDNALTAAGIARQTGILPENTLSEVRPEAKAGFVRSLQHQGHRVAFVGDGINDAPALEQADLGIAVSRASDIAREAADIILLNSEIEAVPESLGLARAALKTIKQNLFWAFFYNAIGVPLAALGFMSPILCAAAMGFSDMVVIGNALRLRNWKLHPAASDPR